MASIKYVSIFILVPIISLLSVVYTATAYAPVEEEINRTESISLGVAPEEFIRIYNHHTKGVSSSKESAKQLISADLMNLSYEQGVGVAKVDYGEQGMLELAVNESDGALLEVKFSDSNEISLSVPVGTLVDWRMR